MKFQCLNPKCKKTFIYTAKSITFKLTGNINREFIHPADHMVKGQFEKNVCPHCGSLDFDELKLEEQNITNVISVTLEEVDNFLKVGYVVHELYAKTATLVKKEAKP